MTTRNEQRKRMGFLSAQPVGVGTRVFDVVLVATMQNGFVFPASVLEKAAGLFNGATVFCDHNPLGEYAEHPSVRDVVGVIWNARVVDSALHGQLYVSASAGWLAALLDFVVEMKLAGVVPPDVGMSADLSFSIDEGRKTNDEGKGAVVKEILKVWSVDVVFDPAAGGETILRALNASAPSLADIFCSDTDAREGEKMLRTFWREQFAFDAEKGDGGGSGERGEGSVGSGAMEISHAVRNDNSARNDNGAARARKALDVTEELLRMQCATVLNQVLGSLELPDIHKVVLRERFEGRVFEAGELTTAIEQQRRVFAATIEKDVIKGIEGRVEMKGRAFVNGMWTDLERFQFAVDRLLGGEVPESMTDVPRLNGIREAYLLATGDYAFRGLFDAGRVQFANATTGTMSGLVAVAMNKVVKAKWAALQPVYGWFHRIVAEEDFDSLNTINWVTVGGFGDLPTVPEGAAYTEMVWDDNTETASWLKKGGYIGLTLEMLDRDQTHKVKQIPTALATAGMRTLSAAVASVLTANAALADGTALFHSTSALRGGDGSTGASGNLSTTALSAAEWDVHIQKTFARSELNSGRRLGLRPKYAIIPIELEKTALQIFSSGIEPTANAFYDNVRVSGSENVVVCPEFTDSNDWYSAVDPQIYPCLGVGYRYGRQPEVFTAGEDTVGSMFTNDELRVKGRFFFGAGVIDWRGLRRASV